MFQLYNTLTNSKEEFAPLHPGKVLMYTCGPTVYDRIHVGNIRAYLSADILRRWLTYLGYEVKHIKNITDVGHLTRDDLVQADTGEDKIEVKARAEKKTPQEIAQFYENYFHNAERQMNILPAHKFPRATKYIPDMIKIIEVLINKGHAYEKNGNVFFDVTTFADYGKLSGNTIEKLKTGARLEAHPDKKHPWDFALWLRAPKEHLMRWSSPWGEGYPGWHIECSAMSTELLGDTIDIHTGGEDNIFPHHEAEIAQSESLTGKPFVRFWMHSRHLLVGGEKMSKSKANFYTLENIKEKGYAPIELRTLLLASHYRKPINFTWESMEQAKSNYATITNFYQRLSECTPDQEATEIIPTSECQKKFEGAMNDDLNTPLALSALFEYISKANHLMETKKLNNAGNVKTLFDRMITVLGLTVSKEVAIPEEIEQLAEERQKARAAKDFERSDQLREEIQKKGYHVEDTKERYKIKKL